MASFYAELHVAGATYPVRACTYEFTQATSERGRVVAKVRHGLVRLTLDVPDDDTLLNWAATPHKPLAGQVTFYDAKGGPVLETLAWEAGQCVGYQEEFTNGDTSTGAYVCRLTIAAPKLTTQPGSPAAYVSPQAGVHASSPPAALALGLAALGGAGGAAAPFVVGADGVPRLPRISGAPPFTVKGAGKGKPGLDRGEFARQLSGQEAGLNRLTVAEFLANRDQYLTRTLLTGDGRDPLGDMAQKELRKESLRDKITELRLEDEELTRDEAQVLAERWLETQAALHDPDQVAGGHAGRVTGLGDARVNSSIGAQWPKRIKAIDAHIRKHAADMSQQERETTYLDVALPLA